jgi:hypothetical protein
VTVPISKPSFSSGELSPQLYGRLDLAKWHQGCSVARNMFISFKGGLTSRAGTAFVGACKQPAAGAPPRLIKFKFNLFQSYVLEFGDHYMRVIANGAYVTEAPFVVTAATQANPAQITAPGHNFINGDAVFLTNLGGMINVDNRIFLVANVNPGISFTLRDIFNTPVDSLGFPPYTVGGTAARIYTLVTPYAAVDLPYLKFTQSADVMSLTCVNQQTQVDYPPQELVRLAANNWTITPTTFASSIGPPTAAAAVTSGGTGTTTTYSYVVTAIDAVTGDESIASNIASTALGGDIALSFGTVTVAWTAPATRTVSSYNVYKSTPSFTNPAVSPVGQLFGFVGSTTGATTWQDTNIISDFTVTPPLHLDPFPSHGNWPGVVAYFQQRRAYAQTLNQPDTYHLSQPGSYTNFDSADPPIDSDAITGTPWATQVNGIQWLLPMPGGLIVLTGEDAWQLSGTAGAGSAITPAQQNAQPQESYGASATLPPIKIAYNILYGQALGSVIRDFAYNFFTNIYTGTDITVLSSHLFDSRTLTQWAWAREPYKVVWAARDDGKLLSLTYLKEQELQGWTRHDTNGLVVSVATASEPPVDAIYWIVKRYIAGRGQWMYFVERMDNRLWANVEQCWCVDCGLALAQPAPAATLTASAAAPSYGINGGTVVLGGQNYTNPQGIVLDPTGSGAAVTLTQVGGVIQPPVIVAAGRDYTAPTLLITDPTGSAGEIILSIDSEITFTASAPIFSAANIGSVLRMGGGNATITSLISPTQVKAAVLAPITTTMPNDPNKMPVPAGAGSWTMTAPFTTVTGLDHLEGMEVSVLADGSVVANPDQPMIVAHGAITLPNPVTQVTVGLPYTVQAQSLHADLPSQNVQGKRKRIPAVTVRMANTRGITVGQDQPIAATLPNQEEIPWGQSPYGPLTAVDDAGNQVNAGIAQPLFSGDRYFVIAGDYSTPDGQASPGMVAVQQLNPLPLELTLLVPELDVGDVP